MLCLIFLIICFFWGALGIVRGELTPLTNKTLKGTPAVIAGILLIIPGACILAASFIFPVANPTPQRVWMIQVGIPLVCILVVMLMAYMFGKPKAATASQEALKDLPPDLPQNR